MFEETISKQTAKNLELLGKSGILKNAEKEPMPNMLEQIDWKEIKKYFEDLVKKLQ